MNWAIGADGRDAVGQTSSRCGSALLRGPSDRETAGRSAASFLLSGQDSRSRMQVPERDGPGMVCCLLGGEESERGQLSM